MAYQSYITYEEYKNLGGVATEYAFDTLERKAQRLVDHITFNRIGLLYFVPDEVKEVITEFINNMDSKKVSVSTTTQSVNDVDNIVQYSNGVETLTWRKQTETEVQKEFLVYAQTVLPDWLTCRMVHFDVERFLSLVPKKYVKPEDELYPGLL